MLKNECESIIHYAETQLKNAPELNMTTGAYIFFKNVVGVATLSLRAQREKAKLDKDIAIGIGNAWARERG